jgi:hypothetical protein
VYARSTTITGDPSLVGPAIGQVREVTWPAVCGFEGCMGLSMLVDRETGCTITTTAWDSERTLRESRSKVMALRDLGKELMGAAPVVDEWEVASMHRLHDTRAGTHVRVAWSRVPHTHVDRALEFYRSALLPEIERLDGFVSASLMVDRALGRGVTSVAFESREAMERTREQADYLREASTNEANVETLDVAEFELALAHLRVPELV